jgi:phage-related protein
MTRNDRPLVWLHGAVKSPPFSASARIETGGLLRSLQEGERLSLPHSRPMPVVGARCHELRVVDGNVSWRLVYRLDTDAVIVAAVFAKSTRATPLLVIRTSRERLRRYDAAVAARE